MRSAYLQIPNVRKLDSTVGMRLDAGHIVAGESAIARAGLSTLLFEEVQLWTLFPVEFGIRNRLWSWYFSPFADKPMHTTPSPEHPNILEPTQERALVEYIIFKDYFDEGILIEGLKTYLFRHDGEVGRLYEVARDFYLPPSYLDYWLDEARNDEDD